MTRERRSLWATISTSMKVSQVSLEAALVYTWAIPHFDDEGYQDGDPRILKGKVIPLRDEITLEDIGKITKELVEVGLWVVHKVNGNIFIQDPVFNDYQTFHGIKKKSSKIQELLERTPSQHQIDTNIGVEMVQDRCLREVNRSEGKGSEEKGSGDGNSPLAVPIIALFDCFKKNCPNLAQPRELNESRKDKLSKRLREHPDQAWWEAVFKKANEVSFTGKDGREWRPTFDWLIENDRNPVKVIEGNYDDRRRQFKPQPGIAAFLQKGMGEKSEA
jgi:hypothetical protein